MLLAESTRPDMGSRVLSEALLKQCLVLTLRRWIELDSSPLPWLAGLADPRLSRVLHTIFEQPAVAYTVESLALMAGMSRSAFADAFRCAFGLSPMSLIKSVRLRRASELLITTTLPVGTEIGGAHVCTPVTTAHLICRLLLEKKNTTQHICRQKQTNN